MFGLKIPRFSLVFKLVSLIAGIVVMATAPIVYLSYQDSVDNAVKSAGTEFGNIARTVSESALLSYTSSQLMFNRMGRYGLAEMGLTLDMYVETFEEGNALKTDAMFKTRRQDIVCGIYKDDGTEMVAHPLMFSFLTQDPVDNHGRNISYYISKERLPYISGDIAGLVRMRTNDLQLQPFLFMLRPMGDKYAWLFYQVSEFEDLKDAYVHSQDEHASDVVRSFPQLPEKSLLSVIEAAKTAHERVIVERRADKSVQFPAVTSGIYQKAQREERAFGIMHDKLGDFVYNVQYIPILDWHIISMMPLETIQSDAMQHVKDLLLVMLGVLIVAVMAGITLLTYFLSPLNAIFEKAKQLVRIDFTSEKEVNHMKNIVAELPQIGDDEIGRLSKAFSAMVDAVVQGFTLLRETLSKQQKIEGELEAAHNIQMSILLSNDEEVRSAGFSAKTWITPAREVGGDFFDAFEAPDGRQAVVMGDVSGKGVSAALFMCVALTLVRGAIGGGLNPDEVLKLVNDGLAARNPSCMFATLWVGLFNPKTGQLDYSNGGHCPPAVLSKDGKVRWIEAVSGLLVGPIPGSEYTMETTQLDDGDLCLLYTDGVSEAMNEHHELFGNDRIESALLAVQRHTPSEMIQSVMKAILEHRGEFEQSDDIAMLAFSYDAVRES